LYSTLVLEIARNITKDPGAGILVGKIAWILGWIVNLFFNFVYNNITEANCLGISIIFLTIFTRCLLLPFAYKSQKSTFAMQALQPELQAIQAKYKDQMSDPEIQKKVNLETQKLYSKHNVNPLGGCLPMIIQLPIFYGLYRIMQNPFYYIDIIGNIYNQISTTILENAGTNNDVLSLVTQFATAAGVTEGTTMDVSLFNRLLNTLSLSQINQFVQLMPGTNIADLYAQKTSIETFMGLNLTETIGFTLSYKLLMPILSGFTTWLSTWIVTRKNKPTDPAMQSQQRVMQITMPLMMAWITTSCPGGVGIYWITSNCFMIVQQFVLMKHFEKKKAEEEANNTKNKGNKKSNEKNNKNNKK
jgi:YidC/Oxa1 family membrane protein insertase